MLAHFEVRTSYFILLTTDFTSTTNFEAYLKLGYPAHSLHFIFLLILSTFCLFSPHCLFSSILQSLHSSTIIYLYSVPVVYLFIYFYILSLYTSVLIFIFLYSFFCFLIFCTPFLFFLLLPTFSFNSLIFLHPFSHIPLLLPSPLRLQASTLECLSKP